jgi:holo-[acyl-carrier protein] synthase
VILGLGVDVVDIARLERARAMHGRRLDQRIFTADELRECAARTDQTAALAARFAAKEACMKALGTGFARGISFRHVEVLRGEDGPRLRLSGGAADRAQVLGVRRMHVSLSHEPGLAVAVVVIEGA